jgi:hypothetical protein
VFPSVSCSSSSVYNGFPQWWSGVWEKNDELRKEGCWWEGKAVGGLGVLWPKSPKTREALGGWLRLEDEGMKKKMERQRGWCVLWSAEGKKKTKGKKAGLGEKGLLVLWSGFSPCVFLRPLCLSPSLFFSVSSPF